MLNKSKLASLFDHTNLKSYATYNDIDFLCDDAIYNGFATVCVYGYWVGYIRAKFGEDLKISQVLNFPTGLSMSHVETLAQISSDADEYDIVMNISKFKEGRVDEVAEELRQVRNYTTGKKLKVIVESGVLTTEELVTATDMVAVVEADFIKTSTGTIPQNEEELLKQVAIISQTIKVHGLGIEIKASGGIKSLEQVKILVGLGVTRIGSSNCVRILRESEGRRK